MSLFERSPRRTRPTATGTAASLALLLSFVLSLAAFLHGSLARADPIPAVDLRGLSFPAPDRGWVVGDDGVVLATSDGGSTWSTQTSGVTSDLLGVDFVDETHGWAVGAGDTVLSTSDGGATWSRTSTGIPLVTLRAVDFVDETHGWAVGSTLTGPVIVATSDGGRTWRPQAAPGPLGLTDASFVDRRRGFVVGFLDSAFATDDGGATWVPMAVSTDADDSLNAVLRPAPQSGVVVTFEGRVHVTDDGGATWTQAEDFDAALRDVARSGETFFAVGDRGLLARSRDGGRSWQAEVSGTTRRLFAVAAPDPSTAVVAGAAASSSTPAVLRRVSFPDGAPARPVPLAVGPLVETCEGLRVAWTSPAAGRLLDAVTGDVDGDGEAEIVAGGTEGVRALRPFRDTERATLWELPFQTRVRQVRLAELDGDPGREVAVGTTGAPARAGVLALDAESGAVLWSARVEGGVRALRPHDFDGDGIQDLAAVATGGANALHVLSGGDGTPIRPARPLGSRPVDLEVADLDGDGTDVVVATDEGEVLAVDGADGSVLWTYEVSDGNLLPVGGGIREDRALSAVAVGDVSGDGVLDVVGVGVGVPRSVSRGRPNAIGRAGGALVAALDGRDGGLLWDYAEPGGHEFEAVALGDLTGDGTPDVVAHGSEPDRGRLVALDGLGRTAAGRATGEPLVLWSFDTTRSTTAGRLHGVPSPDGIDLAEADGDGTPDVFVALENGWVLAVSGRVPAPRLLDPVVTEAEASELWGRGRAEDTRHDFVSVADVGGNRHVLTLDSDHLVALRDAASGELTWAFDAGGAPEMDAGDLDGDGGADLGVAHPSGRVFGLGGDGRHLTAVDRFMPQKVRGVVAIAVDDDAGEEVVAASVDGTVRAVDPLNGAVVWETKLDSPATAIAGGRGTVAVGTTAGTVVGLAASSGELRFERGLPDHISSLAFSEANDVFAAGARDGTLSFFSPTGAFMGGASAGADVAGIAVVDADGDGNDEFGVAAGPAVQLHSHRGARRWRVPVPAVVLEIGGADLDGDGDDEVLAGTFFNLGSPALAYAFSGTTGDILWQVETAFPTGITAIDVEGDGSEEAVVANSRVGGPAAVTAIDAGGEAVARCRTRKVPSGLHAADLDGDGHDDLAVGTLEGDVYLVVPEAEGTPRPPPPRPSPGDPDLERGVYPEAPDDPLFGLAGADLLEPQQWGVKRIRGHEAWQEPRATGFGIRVAVLDSGVDLEHEDLSCPGKLEVVEESDVVGDGNESDDVRGHGTHVAGIIGACTDNGVGVAGVAPDATILPFQVLSRSAGEVEHLVTAIEAAADAGAHVINLSLSVGVAGLPGTGVVGYLPDALPAIDDALEDARDRGVVVVAAAGNASLPLCEYPALAEDIVCVGATDPRDLKAWYSSFPNRRDLSGPAVVAPGGTGQPFCDAHAESILSLFPPELDDCDEGLPGYRDLDGTSMAAPHVAGVAALVYDRLGAERSAANARAVLDAIVSSAVDLGPPGYDPAFGQGRVDALGAVRAAAAPSTPASGTRSATSGQDTGETLVGAGVDDTLAGASRERAGHRPPGRAPRGPRTDPGDQIEGTVPLPQRPGRNDEPVVGLGGSLPGSR